MVQADFEGSEQSLIQCDLCGSDQAREVVCLPAPCMSTDGRRYSFPLRKVICTTCGLIRTAGEVPQSLLDEHYGEGYRLGIMGAAAEPVFFVDGEKVPASLSMADWITMAHEKSALHAPDSILDIGCGSGELLFRLRDHWNGARAVGIDPDVIAVGSAHAKGVDARTDALADLEELFDLIVSVAVIEHLRSPTDFLRQIRTRLSADGAAIIVLPVQDGGNRDILFWDHLHHFHTKHIPVLAVQTGFRLAFQSADHPLHMGFALNVLVPDSVRSDFVVSEEAKNQSVDKIIREWLAIIERLNAWLDEISDRPLTVFGLGETFDILFGYSCLQSVRIAEGLDDNTDRAKARRTVFPVHKPTGDRLAGAEALLVTFAPSPTLRESLNRLRIPVFCLDGE